MKIRTQLVLAFLLLSVVPLTGIVLYSYASSQRAVRKVAEAEAEERWKRSALEGMPLGGLAYDYQELSLEVASGDTLLLMSDGLPELQDEQGEPFGYPRVRQSFQDLGGKAPEDVIAGLGDAARAWTGGKPPNDDVTFVAIRVRA